jgi:hypothetical protein
MKTYEIELKRTSFIAFTVEADSYDQAEELAWASLDNDCLKEDASWELIGIDEVEQAA